MTNANVGKKKKKEKTLRKLKKIITDD